MHDRRFTAQVSYDHLSQTAAHSGAIRSVPLPTFDATVPDEPAKAKPPRLYGPPLQYTAEPPPLFGPPPQYTLGYQPVPLPTLDSSVLSDSPTGHTGGGAGWYESAGDTLNAFGVNLAKGLGSTAFDSLAHQKGAGALMEVQAIAADEFVNSATDDTAPKGQWAGNTAAGAAEVGTGILAGEVALWAFPQVAAAGALATAVFETAAAMGYDWLGKTAWKAGPKLSKLPGWMSGHGGPSSDAGQSQQAYAVGNLQFLGLPGQAGHPTTPAIWAPPWPPKKGNKAPAELWGRPSSAKKKLAARAAPSSSTGMGGGTMIRPSDSSSGKGDATGFGASHSPAKPSKGSNDGDRGGGSAKPSGGSQGGSAGQGSSGSKPSGRGGQRGGTGQGGSGGQPSGGGGQAGGTGQGGSGGQPSGGGCGSGGGGASCGSSDGTSGKKSSSLPAITIFKSPFQPSPQAEEQVEWEHDRSPDVGKPAWGASWRIHLPEDYSGQRVWTPKASVGMGWPPPTLPSWFGGGDTNQRVAWLNPAFTTSLFRNGLPTRKAPTEPYFGPDDNPKRPSGGEGDIGSYYSDPRITDPPIVDAAGRANSAEESRSGARRNRPR
jgi:hypothetical protein